MKLIKAIVIIVAANLTFCKQQEQSSQQLSPQQQQVVKAKPTCLFSPQHTAPDWVCDKPHSGLAIQAVGKFELSFGGRNYMLDMAEILARKQLSERFKREVAARISLYAKTSALNSQVIDTLIMSANQYIDDQSLESAKVYQTETGTDGEVYVLVGMDSPTIKVLIEQVIAKSVQNEKDLWQVFKAQNLEGQLAVAIAAIKDE
ncbi:MAG: LPP20 family lipoprotein [Methylococcaceae bacterium]|nr:LPP20 family lipoprotein [Methylococcaceae bacterium]